MRTLNRAMRIAVDLGDDPESALHQFLSAYRQMPHSTTGCAPTDLLMKRDLRDIILAGPRWKPAVLDSEITEKRRKENNDHASRSRRAVNSNLVLGDHVIMKDRHPGWKFRTPFEREVWTVVAIKGTMVTVQRYNTRVTRNGSWFKWAYSRPSSTRETEAADNDMIVTRPDECDDDGKDCESSSTPAAPTSVRADTQSTVLRESKNTDNIHGSERNCRSQRYNLRPHPVPSQTFRDFVRD